MKIRAISPTVVAYTGKKHWYEKWNFLAVFNYRLRNIGSRVRNILRRRHSTVRMKALNWGQWYDSDIRIFEANFQILVDYVENELAWMQLITEHRATWYYSWFPISDARELALKHLHWEIQLGDDSPGQSEAAKKVRELYLWYKDVRTARPDPWDDVPDRPLEFEDMENGMSRLKPIEDPEYTKALQKGAELEQAYENVDTQMLVELVQIRNMLWT